MGIYVIIVDKSLLSDINTWFTTDMQISFIIPLYNCASTIERCLTSIFSLSMPPGSYEIIVVDDGSKDDGPKVVQRIATGHRQVRLVSQPNRGASSARNRGLELARGEYVWFVDADDKVLPDVQPIELISRIHKTANANKND